MGGTSFDQDSKLTDVEKLKVAALRTHLYAAANREEVFFERLSRLRNAYLMLEGRQHLPAYTKFVAEYNNARSALCSFSRRESIPPAIRA